MPWHFCVHDTHMGMREVENEVEYGRPFERPGPFWLFSENIIFSDKIYLKKVPIFRRIFLNGFFSTDFPPQFFWHFGSFRVKVCSFDFVPLKIIITCFRWNILAYSTANWKANNFFNGSWVRLTKILTQTFWVSIMSKKLRF